MKKRTLAAVGLLGAFTIVAINTYTDMEVLDNSFDKKNPPPNILLVMVDDLGFSDLGAYGSEIETPSLDRLAEQGFRFSQFYSTAKCHSSRISLLTGMYEYQAGGSELSKSITIAELLREAGYFTAMSGKWHLGGKPSEFGFQRSFSHLSGATNYFLGNSTFRLDGAPWAVPQSGFYSTTAITDFALQFLGQARNTQRPWFLYVAYNAPHAPLHAMEEDFMKYEDRYKEGWDLIRAQRYRRQLDSGLVPASWALPPRPGHIPAWETLTPEQRRFESRRMAAYAAIVDRLDAEFGRLVESLKVNGELDNTLILFVSDNGASPYERTIRPDLMPWDPATWWNTGTGWAWVSNAPFRYYKQNQFEGGISTPAILHWPEGIKVPPGEITRTSVHLIDVLPTLLEIVGENYPKNWPDRRVGKPIGTSLLPLLAGRSLSRNQPLYFLYQRDRALREGPWKLVSFRGNSWQLFQIELDRTEMYDLATDHPEIIETLSQRWLDIAKNTDGAPPKLLVSVNQSQYADYHPEWTDYDPAGIEHYPLPLRERQTEQMQ